MGWWGKTRQLEVLVVKWKRTKRIEDKNNDNEMPRASKIVCLVERCPGYS